MSNTDYTYLAFAFGVKQKELVTAFNAVGDEELVEDIDAVLIDVGSMQPSLNFGFEHMYFGMIEATLGNDEESVPFDWEWLKRQQRYIVDQWLELLDSHRKAHWPNKSEPPEATAFFDWLIKRAEAAWENRHDPERPVGKLPPPEVWSWRLVTSRESV